MCLCAYPPALISFTQPLPDDDSPHEDKHDNCPPGPSVRRQRQMEPHQLEITVSKTVMISGGLRWRCVDYCDGRPGDAKLGPLVNIQGDDVCSADCNSKMQAYEYQRWCIPSSTRRHKTLNPSRWDLFKRVKTEISKCKSTSCKCFLY